MRRLSALFFFVAMTSAVFSFADQYEQYRFSKSNEVTAEDLPLDFRVEKVEWTALKNLKVWGSIKNTSAKPHQFVKVTLSAKDPYGKLLTRNYAYADPSDMNPGQMGNIKLYLDLEEEPAIIEYKVTGR